MKDTKENRATISNLIDELIDSVVDDNTHDNCVQRQIDKLKRAIFDGGWVNVNKHLPMAYTNVLLYMVMPINNVPTDLIGIGYLDDDGYWRYADHFGGFSYSADNFDDEWASDFHSKWITHWQPLPEPSVQKER